MPALNAVELRLALKPLRDAVTVQLLIWKPKHMKIKLVFYLAVT